MNRGVGVTEAIRNTVPEWTVPLFEFLSLGGDLLLIVPALALLYAGTVARSLRRPPAASGSQPLCADRTALLIAVVFGGLALVVVLKAVFAMSRPPTELHAVSPSEFGFPSGHTMAATVFWGALALWTSVGRRRVRLGVAGTVVSLVAVSRLALGVHFLVDVLASIAVGSLYLVAIAGLTGGRPGRAFGVTIAIAGIAVLVSGGGSRSLLALAGSIGAACGWWIVERPLVRRRLRQAVEQLRGTSRTGDAGR